MKTTVTHPLDNGLPTIAVFCDSFSSPFSYSISMGASEYAVANGYNLISFAGGTPNDPGVRATARGELFRGVDPSMFAGLILPLGSVSRFMSDAQRREFLQPFQAVPIVAVGAGLEGMISVNLDNKIGIQKMVEHLISVHDYRRIGFLCGPEMHLPSQEKLDGYKTALAQHDIAFDPAYVIYGDLTRYTDDWCIRTFLDERKLNIDAIVTCNDQQAISVIDHLKRRGLRVPEDIAVTGCMDIPECSTYTPSISSVHEPIHDLGTMAARALIAEIEGRQATFRVTVPTSLAIRRSCGCQSEEFSTLIQGYHQQLCDQKRTHNNPKTQLEDRLNEAIQDAIPGLVERFDTRQLHQLVLDFNAIHSLDDAKNALEKLVCQIRGQLGSELIAGWLAIFLVFKQHALDLLSACETPIAVETVRMSCETIYAQLSQKAMNSHSVAFNRAINTSRDLLISLNASFERDRLHHLITQDLQATECYVGLYSENANTAGMVKNLLAIQNGQLLPLEESEREHLAAHLMPDCIKPNPSPYRLIVFPMSFRGTPIGTLVTSVFSQKAVVYGNLQALLSSALNNELQLKAIKAAQAQMLQSEKMAALGGLVAGVAHEINTPIGVILTASTVLTEEIERLNQLIEEGTLRKSDFSRFRDAAAESTAMIQRNSERAAELIRSFKLVAVDQTSEARRTFNLEAYLEEIIVSLQSLLNRTSIIISKDCDPTLEIDGYPGALAQIITNLIANAVHHAFRNNQTGHIRITAHRDKESVVLQFSDNGSGIHVDHLSHIFEPFFTTDRSAGGSGLGLNIVYNIATQTLGGTIAVCSEPGKGTQFTLIFPRISPEPRKEEHHA